LRRNTFSIILILTVMVAGCDWLPKAEDPLLVEDLVQVDSLYTDSLNRMEYGSIKWFIQKGEVSYVHQTKVDWVKELKAFQENHVNHLRFKEAYSVVDSSQGSVRRVSFTANNPSLEVRWMKSVAESGRLVGYELEKTRSNMLSSSRQHFQMEGSQYSLSIEQEIDGVFSNDQFVHGTIVPKGEVWRAEFDLGGDPMPLQCVLQEDQLIVKNAQEFLSFSLQSTEGDSLRFESEFFNGWFQLIAVDDDKMVGRWINEKRDQRKVTPVTLTRGIPYRFNVTSLPDVDLSGEHTIRFADADGELINTAVIHLEQIGPMLTGSILTETGDYRWLDGVVRNDSLLLSTMDGTHAYLFKGKVQADRIDGVFCAGTTWKQKWEVSIGERFDLRTPESITQLTRDSFNFSFPDVSGNLISLDDARFKDKVVLVSVMGTWCSNCLDEALFLKKVKERFPASQVEIVALNFELVNDSAVAKRNMERHIKSLDVEYPVLLAQLGTNSKKASVLFPSLNGIFSYPTLIILDQDHEVVRIHTGFNGPATGKERYQAFEQEYLGLIRDLVNP